MKQLNYLNNLPDNLDIPSHFLSPFSYVPHPLAMYASHELQKRLTEDAPITEEKYGRMFGVLVVLDNQNRIGYLSAFEGFQDDLLSNPIFVPPIVDMKVINDIKREANAIIQLYDVQIISLLEDKKVKDLQARYTKLREEQKKELSELTIKYKKRKTERDEKRKNGELLDVIEYEKLERELAYQSQLDSMERKKAKLSWIEQLNSIESRLQNIKKRRVALEKRKTNAAIESKKKLFSSYKLINGVNQAKSQLDFFPDDPPLEGTGDCVAPRLLQFAYTKNLKPLAIAEFWWGSSPENSIRHHGNFYPACRGRCQAILPFMLKGLKIKERELPFDTSFSSESPEAVYEDGSIVVVNKPCGMLSVPGKDIIDSVQTRMQHRYPSATGPLLLHRLDMATSGLMLIAKNKLAHKKLQQQFINRKIKKRYVAILSQDITKKAGFNGNTTEGMIALPLRVDLNDRPRQVVCMEHGKPAITKWKIVSIASKTTRIHLFPITGRTHQLRMHAAHKNGLDTPILGDKLYGKGADRLYLHAEYLCFSHPNSDEIIEVTSMAPF